MISESKDGLSKMFGDLIQFSTENGLKINSDKTKCMIFNKTGRYIRFSMKCGGMTINTVKEYKYLGFLVTPSGEVTSGVSDLKSRALYAFVQLRKKLGNHFRKDIDMSIYLFDTLVRPILLYCSDFWSILKINKKDPCELLPKQNLIDLVHMKFLKQLLGVQTQTHNVGILLETGGVPIMVYSLKQCIKNWNRIAIKTDCNPLTHLTYKNIFENNFEWYRNIESLLNNLGLGYILNGKEITPEVVVHKRILEVFHQKAFTEISKEKSKLRTYSLLKQEVRREPYLSSVKNVKDRIAMTKLRLSNHELMIEKGRHSNLAISERKCPFCHLVEDEIHFLVTCNIYSILRNDLLNSVEEKLNVELMIRTDKIVMLKYLLGNIEISPLVAKYITKTMELRNFLMNNPKRVT